MKKQFAFTKDGLEKLKEEYTLLNNLKHIEAIERLSKARAMGDLRENSEYHAAKEDLARVVGRKKELEVIIENAVIIDDVPKGVAGIGKKITVKVNSLRQEFTLVGELEANIIEKKLSVTSPIGKALNNKKVGDEVVVQVPSGAVLYKIIAIKE